MLQHLEASWLPLTDIPYTKIASMVLIIKIIMISDKLLPSWHSELQIYCEQMFREAGNNSFHNSLKQHLAHVCRS